MGTSAPSTPALDLLFLLICVTRVTSQIRVFVQPVRTGRERVLDLARLFRVLDLERDELIRGSELELGDAVLFGRKDDDLLSRAPARQLQELANVSHLFGLCITGRRKVTVAVGSGAERDEPWCDVGGCLCYLIATQNWQKERTISDAPTRRATNGCFFHTKMIFHTNNPV